MNRSTSTLVMVKAQRSHTFQKAPIECRYLVFLCFTAKQIKLTMPYNRAAVVNLGLGPVGKVKISPTILDFTGSISDKWFTTMRVENQN